jgi:hypothetical protein
MLSEETGVMQVFPEADGQVRNVEVKTKHGLFERPVTKIAVIEPVEGYEESEDDQ